MTDQPDTTDEDTAYHEAGHAYVAWLMGGRIESVTIAPDWDEGLARFGDTAVSWPVGNLRRRELIERSIAVALAGPVAEMIYRGEPYHPGLVPEWAQDWCAAWSLAAGLVPGELMRLRQLERAARDLYQLLRDDTHWARLASLSDHLLAHETLHAEQLEEIVESWDF